MNPFYTDYSEYMGRIFPGVKVQKISVNAGFSCPNRDGTISRGGCIYCRNESFTPGYCMVTGADVKTQLQNGKRFFRRKYPEMKYLAYFQSFTNTFAPTATLAPLYRAALDDPEAVGLIVGTRPDCLPEPTLDLLASLNCEKPVFLELGAESSHNKTLTRINRGHTWECVEKAVANAAARGLHTGLHLIAGLPGESEVEILETARRGAALPVESLKWHQLQVLHGTELHRQAEAGEADMLEFSLESYLDLCCRIIEVTPKRICLERFVAQAPRELVVSPKWGLKNHEFTNLLLNRLRTRQQGRGQDSGSDKPRPEQERHTQR